MFMYLWRIVSVAVRLQTEVRGETQILKRDICCENRGADMKYITEALRQQVDKQRN